MKAITRSHIEYTYDILTELYALLLRKLISIADEESFSRINSTIDEMERFAKKRDIEGYYDATFIFGAVALQLLQAPLLERIILELWPSKRRIEYYVTSQRKEDLLENIALFRQAFQHARAGDAEKASLSIRTYMQNQKSYALAHAPLD